MHTPISRLIVVAGMTCSSVTFALLPSNTVSSAELEWQEPLSSAAAAKFEREVRPILARHCYECHSAESDEIAGELLLDSEPGWRQGGGRGAAIVPGDPDESLLIQVITYEDPDLQMPPEKKLSPREIQILRDWVRDGAPDPRDDAAANAPLSAEFDPTTRLNHWAWQPIRTPSVPSVNRSQWVRDPVDAFILARLEEAELAPASPTSRAAWLRRVTYDLIGLPPRPQEIAGYLADDSGAADERVVDDLLNRTAFGECWSQHWLDLVRFAETKGHEGDYEVPYAWRYRDYVIRAFNQNVGFDTLIREHVAGDLISPPRIDPVTRTNQSVQGTGFWYLGEATHSPVDIRGEESDRIANQVDVFGKAFLAMTVACARCHDHKFDAISTADYYALCGFIQSSGYHLANVADPEAIAAAARSLESLNQESGTAVWQAQRELLLEGIQHWDLKLMRAAERARLRLADDSSQETEVASDEDGAPSELSQVLQAACRDPRHPLFAFASIALASDSSASLGSVRSVWTQQREESQSAHAKSWVVATRREGELTRIAEREPFDPARHQVVDFSIEGTPTGVAPFWLTGGTAFGSGPLRAGEIVFQTDANSPIREVVAQESAVGHQLSESFTGLFRTPTFEIVGDRLWYRFQGKANVFLAVDSHRTIAGPLHAVVQKKIDSPDKVTWFSHRVDDYLGHRVHVEFQPDGAFTLYDVRFSDQRPVLPWQPNALLVQQLEELDDKASAQQVAAATARAFAAALNVSSIGVAQSRPVLAENASAADLINLLLRHPNWLDTRSSPRADRFRELAAGYIRKREEAESQIPEPVWATTMLDGSAENERIHLRGSHRHLAEEATPRGILEVLGGAVAPTRGSGRLELAERLIADDNPLTARVAVNRIWQHLFGVGIVASSDNFGELGAQPSHPELLDYLADSFRHDGWNVKNLVRRLVLSQTYRMSSVASPRAMAKDPTNRLLHSARVRRLTGEKIRDAILSASGQLDRTEYGPSVRIHITDFMRHNRSPGWSGPMDGDRRRSVYVEVRRNAPSHFLAAFDKPVAFTTVGRRAVSNSPAQPLILLNDPLVHQQAAHWATRLVRDHPDDFAALRAAYLEAFAREPSAQEQARANSFLRLQERGEVGPQRRAEAWTGLCLALYNVKEFIFLP